MSNIKISNLPLRENAVEGDSVVSNVSNTTARVTFKDMVSKMTFSGLATTAKNIIDALNENKDAIESTNDELNEVRSSIPTTNNLRIYTSISQLGLSGSATLLQIYNAMPEPSILYENGASIANSPLSTLGVATVLKVSYYRFSAEVYDGRLYKYYSNAAPPASVPVSSWKLVPTQ